MYSSFNIRNGVNFGHKTFFPEIDETINESALLSIFIGQYYMYKKIPKRNPLNKITKDKKILEFILSKKKTSKVVITNSVRGRDSNLSKWQKKIHFQR